MKKWFFSKSNSSKKTEANRGGGARTAQTFTDKEIREACLTLEAYPCCYTNRNQAGREWGSWLNRAGQPKEQWVNHRGEQVAPPGRKIFEGVESEITDTIIDDSAWLRAKRNALALLYHYAHGHTEDCLCKTWTWYQKEASSTGKPPTSTGNPTTHQLCETEPAKPSDYSGGGPNGTDPGGFSGSPGSSGRNRKVRFADVSTRPIENARRQGDTGDEDGQPVGDDGDLVPVSKRGKGKTVRVPDRDLCSGTLPLDERPQFNDGQSEPQETVTQ